MCKEEMDTDIKLRLSSQRALLGCVTGGLRAVSVEVEENKIKWRCVFGSDIAKESQWEVLSEAAAEVIADFPAPYTIEEEYLVVRFRDSENSPPNNIQHLKNIVFLRNEREKYPELAINT